ncbi:hypothetical protein [Streptomyces sp. NBC_00102]|uniref:hypothetical protein n=1 Tax=Streptomyces sp. NBC_00102 TaxID=2975652 RepID=UPI002256B85A|nr:hypothetical protein [Streptomyces sp. NBC_00102]MCX5401311.1 hypothetical protein [Streptomyces sp. NBC_00102]
MTTLSLALLGADRDLKAEEIPSIVSAHTGRSLRRFALEMRVPEDASEELNAELQAATDGTKYLQGPDAEWQVSSNRYSYTQGERPAIYTYNLEIQEVEGLQASAVEADGMVLVPVQYDESISKDSLVLTLVTEVAGQESERLEELLQTQGDSYFDVVRRGVSETPVRMRFGRCLWQQGDGDVRRHNLTLVADENQPSELAGFAQLNQPQLARTTEKSVATADALALLLEHLHEQGSLNEEAYTTIKAAAVPHKITVREQREFSRTDRLDDFWHKTSTPA